MTQQQGATTGEWGPHSPVVVGVDGSDGGRSALAWAAGEAARAGADLRLVMFADDGGLHPRFPTRFGHERAEELLAGLATEVGDIVPKEQVSTEVWAGDPIRGLLEQADSGARLLVVGKRGLGAIPRLLVGSTSLAVAGRSPVPVAIVPTGWQQPDHATEPLVLGVDPYRPGSHLLHLAFRRAEAFSVPLVAVHGWETPSAPVWTDAPLDEWEREAHEEFHAVLAPWRERFPRVDLRTVASSRHPAMAVLDQVEQGAQLVLLGRHAGNRFTGFGFGSVTRAVLHYVTVPALVVPTPAD